jgi:hypothetical protein
MNHEGEGQDEELSLSGLNNLAAYFHLQAASLQKSIAADQVEYLLCLEFVI